MSDIKDWIEFIEEGQPNHWPQNKITLTPGQIKYLKHMTEGKIKRKVFHKWSWSRVKKGWFWKGQIVCRLFGHEVSNFIEDHCCGRCGISYEEIYPNYFERLINDLEED